MNDVSILQPVAAWLLLVMIVAVRLAVTRVRDFKTQRLSPQAYATRDGRTRLSDACERASDHYQNQFEMPVAFVAACVVVHLAGLSDPTYVTLAWLYIALRVAHTFVHLVYNRVYHRFLVFVASFVPLAVIVARLAWQLFTGD